MDNEDLRNELKSVNKGLKKVIHRRNIYKRRCLKLKRKNNLLTQKQNKFKQWLEGKNQIYLKQHGIVEPTITVREVIDKIREIERN